MNEMNSSYQNFQVIFNLNVPFIQDTPSLQELKINGITQPGFA
jgi:hypothetical protein